MKTRTTIHWLAGVAGGLLLAVPVLGWAASDWGPGGVPGALGRCEADLEACLAEPCAIFPGDGWPEDAPDYAIPGGAPLSYTDNGDGTFTDDNTGLMWEIKTGTVGPSVDCSLDGWTDPECLFAADVNNRYTWSESGIEPDGTAFTYVLATRNKSCGGDTWYMCTEATEEIDCAAAPKSYCGLGGHTDWRLPTAKELQSLVDYSVYDPAVSDGLPGATWRSDYWSSTANANNDDYAWYVNFEYGYVSILQRGLAFRVRAVRGGW